MDAPDTPKSFQSLRRIPKASLKVLRRGSDEDSENNPPTSYSAPNSLEFKSDSSASSAGHKTSIGLGKPQTQQSRLPTPLASFSGRRNVTLGPPTALRVVPPYSPQPQPQHGRNRSSSMPVRKPSGPRKLSTKTSGSSEKPLSPKAAAVEVYSPTRDGLPMPTAFGPRTGQYACPKLKLDTKAASTSSSDGPLSSKAVEVYSPTRDGFPMPTAFSLAPHDGAYGSPKLFPGSVGMQSLRSLSLSLSLSPPLSSPSLPQGAEHAPAPSPTKSSPVAPSPVAGTDGHSPQNLFLPPIPSPPLKTPPPMPTPQHPPAMPYRRALQPPQYFLNAPTPLHPPDSLPPRKASLTAETTAPLPSLPSVSSLSLAAIESGQAGVGVPSPTSPSPIPSRQNPRTANRPRSRTMSDAIPVISPRSVSRTGTPPPPQPERWIDNDAGSWPGNEGPPSPSLNPMGNIPMPPSPFSQGAPIPWGRQRSKTVSTPQTESTTGGESEQNPSVPIIQLPPPAQDSEPSPPTETPTKEWPNLHLRKRPDIFLANGQRVRSPLGVYNEPTKSSPTDSSQLPALVCPEPRLPQSAGGSLPFAQRRPSAPDEQTEQTTLAVPTLIMPQPTIRQNNTADTVPQSSHMQPPQVTRGFRTLAESMNKSLPASPTSTIFVPAPDEELPSTSEQFADADEITVLVRRISLSLGTRPPSDTAMPPSGLRKKIPSVRQKMAELLQDEKRLKGNTEDRHRDEGHTDHVHKSHPSDEHSAKKNAQDNASQASHSFEWDTKFPFGGGEGRESQYSLASLAYLRRSGSTDSLPLPPHIEVPGAPGNDPCKGCGLSLRPPKPPKLPRSPNNRVSAYSLSQLSHHDEDGGDRTSLFDNLPPMKHHLRQKSSIASLKSIRSNGGSSLKHCVCKPDRIEELVETTPEKPKRHSLMKTPRRVKSRPPSSWSSSDHHRATSEDTHGSPPPRKSPSHRRTASDLSGNFIIIQQTPSPPRLHRRNASRELRKIGEDPSPTNGHRRFGSRDKTRHGPRPSQDSQGSPTRPRIMSGGSMDSSFYLDDESLQLFPQPPSSRVNDDSIFSVRGDKGWMPAESFLSNSERDASPKVDPSPTMDDATRLVREDEPGMTAESFISNRRDGSQSTLFKFDSVYSEDSYRQQPLSPVRRPSTVPERSERSSSGCSGDNDKQSKHSDADQDDSDDEPLSFMCPKPQALSFQSQSYSPATKRDYDKRVSPLLPLSLYPHLDPLSHPTPPFSKRRSWGSLSVSSQENLDLLFRNGPSTPSLSGTPKRPLAKSVQRSEHVDAPKPEKKYWMYDLPSEVIINILKYMPIDEIQPFVDLVKGDVEMHCRLTMTAIAAVMERTWAEDTPSSQWRHVLYFPLEMNIPHSYVHVPEKCWKRTKAKRRDHAHELAISLRTARKKWKETTPNKITTTPPNFIITHQGQTHKLLDFLDELHCCRQHHQEEIEFVCFNLLKVYRDTPHDDDRRIHEVIAETVDSEPFHQMWRLMRGPHPAEEFSRTMKLLCHLKCLFSTSVPIKMPTMRQCELVLPVPQINTDGTVAWYDVWRAIKVLVPLARQALDKGHDIGHVSSALAKSSTLSLPRDRPLSLFPTSPVWDWADISGRWHVAMVQYPSATEGPEFKSYGWVHLAPCTLDGIQAALTSYTDRASDRPRFPPSTLDTSLPWSDALPAIYFHGLTRPTTPSQARYYSRGIVRLTTDRPGELRYKIIFRNIDTCIDDLSFEGIQVGGCRSRRGVIGVAFPDLVQREPEPWCVPQWMVSKATMAKTEIQLVARDVVPQVYPCWLWKPDV